MHIGAATAGTVHPGRTVGTSQFGQLAVSVKMQYVLNVCRYGNREFAPGTMPGVLGV